MASADPEFDIWLKDQLSCLLGIPVGDEIISYILSYESSREIKEHFESLLDMTDYNCRKFVEQFFERWKPSSKSSLNSQIYKKSELGDMNIFSGKSPRSTRKKVPTTSPSNLVESANPSHMTNGYANGEIPSGNGEVHSEHKPPTTMEVDTRGASAFLDKNRISNAENIAYHEIVQKESINIPFKKKTLKYVPLFGAKGEVKKDTYMLPGRHACECLGQKHKLINNCIFCGRIVCEQEGAGPCMFCGNLVCTPEDQEIIATESKKSKKLLEKLWKATPEEENDKEAEGLRKAVEHRNKLLNFDKSSVRRTKVYDDEADYFASDSRWLSDKQRTALKKREDELRDKRFASRRDKKYTLDFAGRKVVESETDRRVYDAEDDVVEQVTRGRLSDGNASVSNNNTNPDSIVDPRANFTNPLFVDVEPMDQSDLPKKSHEKSYSGKARSKNRLQDRELQEMGDPGMCLSMHQPWASLLVSGIKRVEGRSWYSAHRGRLWIASTSQKVEKEEIEQWEQSYRNLNPGEDLQFPDNYPVGALLGCVNVIDCLSNEEYFKQYSDAKDESSSQYLFVCEDPLELALKLPMRGQHKIYKLEPHIHTAAKKTLRR